AGVSDRAAPVAILSNQRPRGVRARAASRRPARLALRLGASALAGLRRRGARIAGYARQDIAQRVVDPGLVDEFTVHDLLACRQEHDTARTQSPGQRAKKIDPALGEQLLQRGILIAGGARIGTEEEGPLAPFDPVRKLVQLGIKRIEQDDAAQPVADAP